MAVTFRFVSAGRSDTGRKRLANEDRILVDAQRGVYLVVDGVGGQAAGERAAQVAVEIIEGRLARQTGTPVKRVREAFALASTTIFELASSDPELNGMACVATLALFRDDHVFVGHVGDTRMYLLEPGHIRKVTQDHSPVGELEDAGRLNEQAAMRHPRRNEVYRDLGSAPHAPDDPEFVEVYELDLPSASALLLCSDGLTDQVASDEIRRLVEHHAGDPDAGVLALIAAANEAGGKDNVSVILVETTQYAGIARREAVSGEISETHRWKWFLGGLLAATVMLGVLRPYVDDTTSGARLRFGSVRVPQTWAVGAHGISTISEALERARAGDTISVEPGEYHENVHLRSGVSLVSTEEHGARLEAPGTVVICENVQNVRFSGFDILGPGKVGMRLANSAVNVSGVRISGMASAAVEIEGGRPSFEASTVEGNPGIGIYVHGGASPRIEHNIISNNGRGAELMPGVFIQGSATPHLLGNIIANNGAEQVWVSPFVNAAGLLKDNVVAPSAPESSHDLKVVTR